MFSRSARPFQRHRFRRGSVTVNLTQVERAVVAALLDDVSALLDADPEPAGPGGPGDPGRPSPEPGPVADPWEQLEASVRVEPPRDPAVARLLPDGHREDPEAAQSFRRLTEPGLRDAKRSTLLRAATALRRTDPVVLEAGEAEALLRGLTDVRLVLAERIGLRTDEDAVALHERLALLVGRAGAGEVELTEAEDHWAHLASLYEAMTWWQEELVAAVR